MTTVTHVMLDLETWGLTPGSDIRSIGACVFDPLSGLIGEDLMLGGEFHLAVEMPQLEQRFVDGNVKFRPKYGLTRDPNTVKWWSEQSSKAQSAFADPTDLDIGLRQFADWLDNCAEIGRQSIALWANGPHFDEAILAACYRACCLPVPWLYRAPRDCRTIWEAAGGIDLPFEGTAHNALDDAKHQARCVIEAYRKLGISIARDAVRAVYLDSERLYADWQASAPEGDRANPFAWAEQIQNFQGEPCLTGPAT